MIKGVSIGRANILSTNKKILHYDTLQELVNKLLTSNIDAKSINKGSFGKRCAFNDRTFELIGLIDGKIDYSGIKDIRIRQVSYYGTDNIIR